MTAFSGVRLAAAHGGLHLDWPTLWLIFLRPQDFPAWQIAG
jgi:hypothetical protein